MAYKSILNGRVQSPGKTAAQLLVDKHDPFFFDHTLDHVPGILVVAGLLDLVREETPGPRRDGRIELSLGFHRFCGLDDDITLSVAAPPSGSHEEHHRQLHAEIGDDPACSGTVVLHQKSSTRFAPATPVRMGGSLPVADLSHRARPENCFIEAAWWHEGRLLADVRKPAVGHPLHERPLEQLIEAARQFATLIGHAGYGKPVDSKFVLRTLDADLPLMPPSDDVYMEWTGLPPKGRAFDLGMRIYRRYGDGLDEEVGSANFDTLIVDPHQYQRIRFRRKRTEEHAA